MKRRRFSKRQFARLMKAGEALRKRAKKETFGMKAITADELRFRVD